MPTHQQEQLQTARYWLERFGIAGLESRSRSKRSGGECGLIALARAFAVPADLLLLDEPYTDLDQPRIDALDQALAEKQTATGIIPSPTMLPSNLKHRIHEI